MRTFTTCQGKANGAAWLAVAEFLAVQKLSIALRALESLALPDGNHGEMFDQGATV